MGAKAGIGVGVAVTAITIIVAATWLLLRWRRKVQEQTSPANLSAGIESARISTVLGELDQDKPPTYKGSELHGYSLMERSELGGEQRNVYELS